MTYRSLMDEFLALVDSSRGEAWFQANAGAFLEVCDLFGRTAVQHHDLLVKRFIEAPAARLAPAHLQGLTASGPPLPVLLRSLETLRDLRSAAPRADLATRHRDLQRIRNALTPGPDGSGAATAD